MRHEILTFCCKHENRYFLEVKQKKKKFCVLLLNLLKIIYIYLLKSLIYFFLSLG